MTRVPNRFALHATLAVSLPLLSLAGCQAPSAAPALGDAPPAALAPSEPMRYVAAPTALKLDSVTATINPTSANRAIDGNTDTHWNSGQAVKPVFRLTLAARAELTSRKIKLNPNVGSYTVETSDDAQSWKVALTGQKNTTWQVEEKKLPANTTGKHVRLTFDNGGKAIMVFEASVMGGAIAPVVGSGRWAACTARVSMCNVMVSLSGLRQPMIRNACRKPNVRDRRPLCQ